MHGRLKVRTSAELQAIQKKKDEEKAAIYEAKMKDILRKKKNSEYDDELLSLTSDIIFMNPDVATVWNARKERLKDLKTKGVDVSRDEIKSELKLTETGLRINPKSYCSWHHRCWILENFAGQSEWAEELKVCTKYLELDDRNFHCWDYRRYIIARYEAQLEKEPQETLLENELQFSLQKLESNFSNYSAWHYRSKLIPRVHSTFEREKLFENDVYQNEISLVENAVYTDPNDQSAWFYHRWLLGHMCQSSIITQAGYDADSHRAWVAVHPSHPSMRLQGLDKSSWTPLNGDECSNVLVKNCNEIITEDITLTIDNEIVDRIMLLPTKEFFRPASFKPYLNEQEENCLRTQLKSYSKLLELEPGSKWTQLAVLMIKEKLGENIDSSALEHLQSNDSYRRKYYSDLASRYKMESILRSVEDWHGSFLMTSQNLTALYHSHFFTLFEEVDLSKNPLGNEVIAKLGPLLSCKVLRLSNCKITSIETFPTLPQLQNLDLSENRIICCEAPLALLNCVRLQSIDLRGSEVRENFSRIIAEKLKVTLSV